MISIAIDDDETKNVLVVGVAQDADVQRVVVGPAIGEVQGIAVKKSNLEDAAVGETAYILASCVIDEQVTLARLTQDGHNALTCVKEEDGNEIIFFKVLDKAVAVPANATLKLSAAEPQGEVANLPAIKVEIGSFNNDAFGKILHAPYDNQFDGSAGFALIKTMQGGVVEWGELINTAYTQ